MYIAVEPRHIPTSFGGQRCAERGLQGSEVPQGFERTGKNGSPGTASHLIRAQCVDDGNQNGLLYFAEKGEATWSTTRRDTNEQPIRS
jgi:hypothetical protein